MLASREKYKNTPLIWGTRSLFGLTRFRSDFINYVDADTPVKDVTKVNCLLVLEK